MNKMNKINEINNMNKIKCLFLDDERTPKDVTWIDEYPNNNKVYFIIVRDDETFIRQVNNLFMTCEPFMISFDHDLQLFKNNKEITGYDLLKNILDLSEYYDYIPVCLFHTQNPIGKENMLAYYNNYRKHKEYFRLNG